MPHSLIQKAQAFAFKVHGDINHRRKYTDEPYTDHLRAVAALVEEVSGTPEMIAAAWLHDAVEDTGATIETIENEFGIKVATLVDELTDVSRPENGNRAKRKAIDRLRIANASPAAKTVKLADLIDNTRTIEQYDLSFSNVYMREKKLLLEVLLEGDPKLYVRAQEIVTQYFGE